MVNDKRTWLGALALLLLCAPALAAIPKTVQIEGALVATGGGPVADGDYTITFALYGAETGGLAAWSETATVALKNGAFAHSLGSVNALAEQQIASLGQTWIGAAVKGEKEMPRGQLHSALYARRAFVAENAMALLCTGCVSLTALKFDGDINLQNNALSAAKVTASTIVAQQFIGDGSNLTGVKLGAMACKDAGYVMRGVNADGTPACVKMSSGGGTGDPIFSKEFSYTFTGSKDVDIPDYNKVGILDTIEVGDVGNALKLEVVVEITKAPFVDVKPKDGLPDYDPHDLTVMLLPPSTPDLPPQRSNAVNNFLSKPSLDTNKWPYYLLHQGGDTGVLSLVQTYPTTRKPLTGDLSQWIGKNPKGKWRLFVIDNEDRADANGKDVTLDGKLVTWSIKLSTVSDKNIQVNGGLYINDGAKSLPAARVAKAYDDKLEPDKSMTLDTGSTSPGMVVQAWYYDEVLKSWRRGYDNAYGYYYNCPTSVCGTGANGVYNATSNTTLNGTIYNYKTFTINKGVTVSTNYTTTPLTIRATEKIVIAGNLVLDGTKGTDASTSSSYPPGGYGRSGGWYGGPGARYYSYNGQNGQGYSSGYGRYGNYNGYTGISGNGCGSGGGGGAHATAGGTGEGSGGAGGTAYQSIDKDQLRGGSGGGGGGGASWANSGGSAGGGGGGAVLLVAPEIEITGTITANGGPGGNINSGYDGGLGGGGAGGAIWIRGGRVSIVGDLSALGGASGQRLQGTSQNCGGLGGKGGDGRIRIDSYTPVTPAKSTPAATKGSSTDLPPPPNRFKIEQKTAGKVTLTNESGVPMKVHLTAIW